MSNTNHHHKMNTFLKSIRITIAFCIFFSVFYVAILWGFGKVFGPGQGNAETVTLNGKVVGAAQIGQAFTRDIYFWGRPSAVDYAGDASGASNKGATNEGYLQEVRVRIDSFLCHHPYLKREEVPAEMVTASASGLDPHITPECAYVQVKRVAQARHMAEEKVRAIVDEQTEKPLLGMLGTAKVNVLKLNVALEEAHPTQH